MAEKNDSLTLGIDIDGTVTEPSYFIPYLNKAFGKNFTSREIVDYHFYPLYGVTEAEMAEWFRRNNPYIYTVAPLQTGARQALQTLSRKNHRLIYISARQAIDYPTTDRWFKKHELPYDAIHLIGSHDKIAKARETHVQLFIEDKYDNACDISEALAIPVILFDTPYNQGPLPEKVIRLYHWEEVPSVVAKAAQGRILSV